jgi:hypothetical protein
MSDKVTIRQPRSQVKKPHCVLCGSTLDIERHHVGGRYHVAWFTIALCRNHHLRITAALRQAGIDMSYAPNTRERLARARKALAVFLWMLEERLDEFERKETQE